MMSRAAQTHLAGLMRPAGRVFETPGIGDKDLNYKFEWTIPIVLLEYKSVKEAYK